MFETWSKLKNVFCECRLSEICLKFLWRVEKYDLKNVATFSRKITTAIPTKTLSVSPLKETTVAIVMKLLLDCGDLWTHAQRFFCQDVDQIPNWAQELFLKKRTEIHSSNYESNHKTKCLCTFWCSAAAHDRLSRCRSVKLHTFFQALKPTWQQNSCFLLKISRVQIWKVEWKRATRIGDSRLIVIPKN